MIRAGFGDQLTITVSSQPNGELTAHFNDFYRSDALGWLFAIFVLVSVLINGWKGVRSLLGILLSLGVIILIILPGI